jgi:hypothetical protein
MPSVRPFGYHRFWDAPSIVIMIRYAEAAHAATRALSLNPQSLEARYQRGVARAAQGLLKAAKIGSSYNSLLDYPPILLNYRFRIDTLPRLYARSRSIRTL